MTMRFLRTVTVAAVALGFWTLAYAQSSLIDGQVTKIDKPAGKMTLRHGPIKKFDMDGMTMVFRVKDPAMLNQVKVGDKVKFDADKIEGQFTVTKIELSK